MFLDYIKNYLLKRILKKALANVENDSAKGQVNTVGVLVDGDSFFQTEALVKQLVSVGIAEEKIQVFVYRKKVKKEEVVLESVFSIKDFNWKGQVKNPELIDFLEQKFDLLINYYDKENNLLLNSSNNSKALFKVGFSTVDRRLNHLMIHTEIENYVVFIHELFKYLKILNKI